MSKENKSCAGERDTGGRLTKGDRYVLGNPFGRRVTALRQEVVEEAEADDCKADTLEILPLRSVLAVHLRRGDHDKIAVTQTLPQRPSSGRPCLLGTWARAFARKHRGHT